MQKDFDGFLRSLLHQIFTQRPETFQNVRPLPRGWLSRELLEQVFLEALVDIGHHGSTTYLVIDALDECGECDERGEEARSGYFRFLWWAVERARSEDIQFRLFISSRPERGLMRVPETAFVIRMEDENNYDIRLYIESQITVAVGNGLIPPGLEPTLRNEILRTVDGNFLFAELLTRSVTRKLDERLDELLLNMERLRQDLDHVMMIFRTSREESVKILQCALAAQQPLDPQEFAVASGAFQLDEADARTQSSKVSPSGGLLKIQDQKVDFAYPMVREFLESRYISRFFGGKPLLAQGHQQFLRASVRCLKEFASAYSSIWVNTPPPYFDTRLFPVGGSESYISDYFVSKCFLSYAVRYLFIHAKAAETDITHDLMQLLDRYPPAAEPERQIHVLDMWGYIQDCVEGTRVYTPSMTLLHVVARYNMAEFISWWLAEGKDYKARTKTDQSALHWAALYGSRKAAGVLIERSLQDELESRIKTAKKPKSEASQAPAEKQDFLRNSRDAQGCTPLHLAASEGHASIVELLISSHQDLRDGLRQELEKAGTQAEVISEHLDTVENPLNLQDNGGNTALRLAVLHGHPSVVEALLQNGANWRLQNNKAAREETLEAMAIRLGNDNVGDKKLKQRFKSIVRLLKTAAFAALDLAELPLPEAKSVDEMFEATIVQILPEEATCGSIEQTPVLVRELISGRQVINKAIQHKEKGFTWIHLPANNVSVCLSIIEF